MLLAPQLQLDQLFTPTMAFNHHFLDSPKSDKQNGTLSPDLPRSPRPQPSPTTKNLNGLDRHDYPPPSEIDSSFNSPQVLSTMSTPTSERNPMWSSAVGKATTGGKSGRVIERLMNDNDRLLREKKLATVKLEEELKRGESARSALESLQVSNENLVLMHESDTSLLLKRDRRIQELREELKAETARRERAEENTRDSRRERDETVEMVRREAVEDKELSKRATSQYDVLSKSWKSLEDRYERQTKSLKADLLDLWTHMRSDKEKLARLEVIMEQLRQEAEKSRKAKEKLWSEFEEYKQEQVGGIKDIRESAALNDKAMNHAQQKMESILGQMKYVVSVKRDLRESE